MVDKLIGFVGAGAMGGALIGGLLEAGVVGPTQVLAADPDPARRAHLGERYGIEVTAENREVVSSCPTVVLAVKPQVARGLLADLGKEFRTGQTVISIMAGWEIARLSSFLPPGVKVVRAMPNTPCQIQQGVTVLAYGPGVSEEDRELARRIFRAVGEVIELPESLMDAATAVSGCGPAYVFLFMEALVDAGVKLGLPREASRLLTTQTVAGAATMAQRLDLHLAQLKDLVASPGGATIHALGVLEEAGWRGTLIRAASAAWRRTRQLGRKED